MCMHMAGRPGTNDAAADPERKRRAAMPAGWGRVPGHEVAFSDRLPYLLTSEVRQQVTCRDSAACKQIFADMT